MSASPSKDDVEQAAQSPEDPDPQMNQDPNSLGLAFEFDVKEQDRWLPIANVARIMKTALPENAKIAKEAKECMQECVSEFISFITSEASDKCKLEKRKTVNGEDILFAMTSLGFENYAEALKIYLSKYRDSQASRNENRPGSQGFGSASTSGQRETRNMNSSLPSTEAPSNSLATRQTKVEGDHNTSYGSLYGNQTNKRNGTAKTEKY